MGFSVKINGTRDVQAGTITNASVSATAAIAESKLLLDQNTQDLYDGSLRVDESRVVGEDVLITFPITGFAMKDSVNGKIYKMTLANGVLVATEILA